MSREYTPEEAKALLMKATQLKIKLIERDLQELRKKEAKKASAAISAGGGIEDLAHAKLNPPGKDDPMPLKKKPVEKGEPMEDSAHGEEETSGEKSPADVIDDAVKKSEDTTVLSRTKRPAAAQPAVPKITPQPAVAAGLAGQDSNREKVAGSMGAEGLPPPGAKQRTLISNPTNPSWMKKEMGADEKCEKCGMEKSAHEMEKRCWEGYEPVPGKKPYSKGSCAPAKKAELVDAKGNTKSNSEDPSATMPDDGSKHYNEPGKDYTKSKAKLVSKEGSGGSIEKGKGPMAKSGEKLRNPDPESGGWVATEPDREGASAISSFRSYGKDFTPAGESISQADDAQAESNDSSAYEAASRHLAGLPEHHKEKLAQKHGITPRHMAQDGRDGWGMWGDSEPPSWQEFRDSRLAEAMSKPQVIPQKTTPRMGTKFTAAGPLVSKSATPPMAKPPSGANMATKVPTSKPAMKTAKPELEKGVMVAAPPKAAVAKPMASPAPAKPGIFGRLMGKK
jgi:hypothetical protein